MLILLAPTKITFQAMITSGGNQTLWWAWCCQELVNLSSMFKVRQALENGVSCMTEHMYKPQVTWGNFCCTEKKPQVGRSGQWGPGNAEWHCRATWHQGFGLQQQPLLKVNFSEHILKCSPYPVYNHSWTSNPGSQGHLSLEKKKKKKIWKCLS